jgi:phosphate transport system substrate-binding protein
MKQKIILIIICISIICACKNTKNRDVQDTLTAGTIQIAVSENFKNIINAELNVFAVHYPEAFIIPNYISENQAIQWLIDDSVRLAVTSRNLTDYEKSKIPKTRVFSKYVFAFEGIAIIANKANMDTLLSIADLRKILKGEILTWQKLNPKSKSDTIRVIFNNNESSALRYVLDSLTFGTEKITPNIYAMKSTKELIDKINNMPNAIGIVGLNQLGNESSNLYNQTLKKVRMIYVSKENKATPENSVLPYAGNLNQGKYPLWRPIYIILSETREGLPKGFCFFLTQQVGQKVVLKAGLMPITDVQNTWTQWND